MFPLNTGNARSHPLNTDVKEQGSGQTVENHPQLPPVPDSTRLWASRALAAGGVSATSHSEQWEREAKDPHPADPPPLSCSRAAAGDLVSVLLSLKVWEQEANIPLYVYSFAAHCYLCRWERERIQNALKELRLS